MAPGAQTTGQPETMPLTPEQRELWERTAPLRELASKTLEASRKAVRADERSSNLGVADLGVAMAVLVGVWLFTRWFIAIPAAIAVGYLTHRLVEPLQRNVSSALAKDLAERLRGVMPKDAILFLAVLRAHSATVQIPPELRSGVDKALQWLEIRVRDRLAEVEPLEQELLVIDQILRAEAKAREEREHEENLQAQRAKEERGRIRALFSICGLSVDDPTVVVPPIDVFSIRFTEPSSRIPLGGNDIGTIRIALTESHLVFAFFPGHVFRVGYDCVERFTGPEWLESRPFELALRVCLEHRIGPTARLHGGATVGGASSPVFAAFRFELFKADWEKWGTVLTARLQPGPAPRCPVCHMMALQIRRSESGRLFSSETYPTIAATCPLCRVEAVYNFRVGAFIPTGAKPPSA